MGHSDNTSLTYTNSNGVTKTEHKYYSGLMEYM